MDADRTRLPRPALWPPGSRDQPFRGKEEDDASAPTSRRLRLAWLAVAVMVAGAVLVGVAVATMTWPPLVAGVVVGVGGLVLAWRARIMQDVSVTDSPRGPA